MSRWCIIVAFALYVMYICVSFVMWRLSVVCIDALLLYVFMCIYMCE